MSVPRFYVPQLPSSGLVELPEAEAHHATRALRCQIQDPVVLFDGRGYQANALIEDIGKKSVTAKILDHVFAPKDHNDRLHFAIALPKGDRQRSTIEHLVELGVDSLTPLTTERSVARIHEDNVERLHRYAIESCKQCQRNRLMKIHTSIDLDQLLSQHHDKSVWFLHPYRENALEMHNASSQPPSLLDGAAGLMFVIGPEGGFSEPEIVKAIAAGARTMSLGERILRVETAVATAAVLAQQWLSSIDSRQR